MALQADKYFDMESKLESDASEDSEDSEETDSDADEYDFDDGFLVSDSESLEEDSSSKQNSLQEDMLFEKARAEAALNEVYQLKKRVKTFKRKLREMHVRKKKWEKRAKTLLLKPPEMPSEMPFETNTTTEAKTSSPKAKNKLKLII